METETRTDLDILRDALAWVGDDLACIHLDPEAIAAELRGMIERMEKTLGKENA